MQQFITSAEACALLDRILQTAQSLSQTRASLFGSEPELAPISSLQPAAEPPRVPAVAAPSPVLSPRKGSIAPVLTIKLADLIREGAEARERRNQHVRPQRPVNTQRPIRRPLPRDMRPVEVLYRKTHRMAS